MSKVITSITPTIPTHQGPRTLPSGIENSKCVSTQLIPGGTARLRHFNDHEPAKTPYGSSTRISIVAIKPLPSARSTTLLDFQTLSFPRHDNTLPVP
ncbi:hypothetical protein K491DRAFT_367826 [Lophiostoma macrostomum CBS 122681]|uniref:Uncharacterized protein n=1 Tax=Lophiostoma macrostomum CBS 122681 TaxID=1314788 RepID=A0A6A6T9R7_9PLEO|nr:hypothetical protein K491DRAFT_367826 [Lophiostoma macrostomum CBS 122681]